VPDVEVRYAVRPDGKNIAFEVFGSGPCDVVVSKDSFPIDLMWDLPQLGAFMETLGGFARVIVFDSLGSGASDPISDMEAAGVESVGADGLAVLDAVGSRHATHLDLSFGANAVWFAATYPQRTRSLILNNLRPSFPEIRGFSAEQLRRVAEARTTTQSLQWEAPRLAHDPTLRQWWGRARRLLTTREVAFLVMEYGARIDVDSILPAVRVPTLVFHRLDNRLWDIDTSRRAASRIPGAHFVELPGDETPLFLGDTKPVLAEIERFLHHDDAEASEDRPLATVLFTDIVASTEQLAAMGDDAWRRVLDDHDDIVDQTVSAHHGRVIKHLGDGILATFDGPARAVRCAIAIRDAQAEHGIAVRSGLHTGEIELRHDDITGIAVHIASRIATLARPGEILASRTVVDLTAGSNLQFEPRGDHQLKGVPGDWPIFAAR
jgi:class 3 adenylate cyclase